MESRRLRTQAERDADGTTWRAAAQSRPGYCTWPQTRPGDPSWWLRDVPPAGFATGGVIDGDAPAFVPSGCSTTGLILPPPGEHDRCAKWCGFCHLGNGEPAPTHVRCGNSTFPLIGGGALICTLAAGHDGGHRDDSGTEWTPISNRSTLISQPPSRRRWWHRYTRRTR